MKTATSERVHPILGEVVPLFRGKKSPKEELVSFVKGVRKGSFDRFRLSSIAEELKQEFPEITLVVGTRSSFLVRKLAKELGARTYFGPPNKDWEDLRISRKDRILLVELLATSCECFERLYERVRLSNKGHIRPNQFVPAVVALVSPEGMCAALGGIPVISLHQVNPKTWKKKSCRNCICIKKNRTSKGGRHS